MNNPGFTPRPWKWYWRVDEEGYADCGVFWEKREGTAYSVCRAPKYQKREQWEADASLIAAAPEMFDALMMASQAIHPDSIVGIQIKKALRSANGEGREANE